MNLQIIVICLLLSGYQYVSGVSELFETIFLEYYDKQGPGGYNGGNYEKDGDGDYKLMSIFDSQQQLQDFCENRKERPRGYTEHADGTQINARLRLVWSRRDVDIKAIRCTYYGSKRTSTPHIYIPSHEGFVMVRFIRNPPMVKFY